jgi:hypothetical protein
MAASVRIEFDLEPIRVKLDLVAGAMSKLETLGSAMKAALQPTAKAASSLVSQEGMSDYTPRRGKRAGKPKLKDQMRATSRIYPRRKVIVGVAGPQYKRIGGGNHGHLVEFGHRVVTGGSVARVGKWASKGVASARSVARTGKGRVAGQVAGKPFLEPAAERTKASAQAHFEGAVGKFVDAALRAMNG